MSPLTPAVSLTPAVPLTPTVPFTPTYPPQDTFDNYTFLPFSFLLAVFWIFTYYLVPETKNKTFEEISAIFQKGAADR
jgi:SP family facilitated glucose transporter-like MFS transporter 1